MNQITPVAYQKACDMVVDYPNHLDKNGHSHSYYYQKFFLELYSDSQIISGLVAGYKEDRCTSEHWAFDGDVSPTDECRIFRHSTGGHDHFNIRWFEEWCRDNNRNHLLKRVFNLKAFW